MSEKDDVMEKIRSAFADAEFPGERFLQGSYEGGEPYDEVSPFEDKRSWQDVAPSFLDVHSSALSFFSEAGFRFFLPAYLIADLKGQLRTADPLFHLTHGFSEVTVQVPVNDRVFIVKSGKSTFVNPKRYGALTFNDHARFRLSIFTREEAAAIVAYLGYKRDYDSEASAKAAIDAALDLFWLERQETAPTAASLKQWVMEQEAYVAALQANR